MAERAPSRQTGAICIRHYDDGHNPYTEAKDLLANAVAKPLEPCKFKERFLIQHIAESKAMEDRKRATNTFERGREERRAVQQSLPFSCLAEKRVEDSRLVLSELLPEGEAASSRTNHVERLQAHFNFLDDELYGQTQIVHDNAHALDGVMYLEWEQALRRHNDNNLWEDAVGSEMDVRLCGVSISHSIVTAIVDSDGKVQLERLLKALYNNLTDEGLSRLAAAADKVRPIPLVFNSTRAVHRYYSDVLKRFSKGNKVSRRSGKQGLDRSEFLAFCHSARVMSKKDAEHTFDQFAVEAMNGSVGRVFTADEFGSLYKV